MIGMCYKPPAQRTMPSKLSTNSLRIWAVLITLSGTIFLITSIGQNGPFKPMQRLQRPTPSNCPHLWWPEADYHLLRPNTSVTTWMYRGNACIKDPNAKETRTALQKALDTSMKQVKSLPKILQSSDMTAIPSHNIAIGHFQHVDLTNAYVVSAFADRRLDPSPDIKVLLVSPTPSSSFYCQTWCAEKYTIVRGTSQFLPFFTTAHERCIWHPFLLHCLFPIGCEPATVSVTSLPCLRPSNVLDVIETHFMYKPPYTLGVCLNTIFNTTDADIGKLIEFIETFRYFKGSIIYLYGTHNVTNNVHRVVAYYVKIGMVRYYNWSIPGDVTSLFYFGQVLQNTDCLYRHTREVQYLVYLDLDEAFYPLQHHNYPEMFSDLHNHQGAGWSVTRMKTDWRDSPSSRVDQVHFCPEPQHKPLVRPSRTMQVAIHYVVQPLRPFHYVPVLDTSMGVIFHYRKGQFDCVKRRVRRLEQSMWEVMVTTQEIIRRQSELVMQELGLKVSIAVGTQK